MKLIKCLKQTYYFQKKARLHGREQRLSPYMKKVLLLQTQIQRVRCEEIKIVVLCVCLFCDMTYQ